MPVTGARSQPSRSVSTVSVAASASAPGQDPGEQLVERGAALTIDRELASANARAGVSILVTLANTYRVDGKFKRTDGKGS